MRFETKVWFWCPVWLGHKRVAQRWTLVLKKNLRVGGRRGKKWKLLVRAGGDWRTQGAVRLEELGLGKICCFEDFL